MDSLGFGQTDFSNLLDKVFLSQLLATLSVLQVNASEW